MATPYQNRLYGHAWFSATANVTIALADCAANTTENVQNIAITNIIHSGPWSIYRGSNLVWQTSNTDYTFDFAAHGTALSQYSGATLVCNTASTTASILIQVSKQSTANGAGTINGSGTAVGP
jgi:hypothetical protein